jgi:hypothetical protein
MRRPSRLRRSAQGILPYEIEEGEGESRITSYAGLPLVAEAYRATGAAEAVRRFVKTRTRVRDRGLTDEEMAESFCVMLAAGGECNDDFRFMRSDAGLRGMLGHDLPSPTKAKPFLYAFHEAEKEDSVRQQRALIPSFVPEESGPLAGLHEALRRTAWAMQAHRPIEEATIDLDATIIGSEKEEAERTYTGERGYQPLTAYWVEKELILADEFRDGNVPAGSDMLRVAKRAIATLPDGIKRIYLRSDSAAYEHRLLNWCREALEEHPPITFAISAVMSVELRKAIEALPAAAWREMDRKGDALRSWAEVEFIPSAPSVKKGRRPDRYVAIRVLRKQGELFSDGDRVKHFAVVTNDWEREGNELIEWHRQKAGTIEKLHDVLKNDLGAGVMPCGRFGASAAWFRMNALTYNLLSVVRQTALPKALEKAQPKRLRFRVLCVAGEVIHHARKFVVRVVGRVLAKEGLLVRARRRLERLRRRLLRRRAPLLAPT